MKFKSLYTSLLVLIFLVGCFVESKPVKNGKNKKGNKMSSKSMQKKYLKQLGYMPENKRKTEDEQLVEALTSFQETWDLPITGQMDEATMALMNEDRCGSPDTNLIQQKKKGKGSKSRRSKRFAILTGGGWPKTDLTYRIVNSSTVKTSDSASAADVERAIADAFAVWSAVTPLTFKSINTRADIDIYFAVNEHCAASAFDGPSGVLAHAYSPGTNFQRDGYDYAGDVHFDDAEDWTLNVARGNVIDVYLVAVHEFGHSLGLDHSDVLGAIMYPYYSYQVSFQLNSDDVAGIQDLYGSPLSSSTTPTTSTTTTTATTPTSTTAVTTPTTTTAATGTPTSTITTPSTTTTITTSTTSTTATTPTTTTTTPTSTTTSTTTATNSPNNLPDFCDDASIDAMTEDYTNNMFIFKGAHYAVLDYRYQMKDGFPRLIKDDFPELPTDIEAAVYVPKLYRRVCYPTYCTYSVAEQRSVYLFKSGTYYRYSKGRLNSNYFAGSGSIESKFGAGLPNKIDSVFSIFGVRLYFTSGDNYWRVTRAKRSPSIDTNKSYPASLSNAFTGLPSSGVDATFNAVYYSYRSYRYYYINYFFSGSQYYRVTNGNSQVDPVDPPYPRSTGRYWFGCPSGSGLSANEVGDASSDENNANIQDDEASNLKAQSKVFVDENDHVIANF